MNQFFKRCILRLRLRFMAALGAKLANNTLLWAALIGFFGGISSAAFREANIGLKWLLTGESGDIVAIAADLNTEMRLLVPCLGGFLSGLVLWLGARLFKGMRSQDYLEVIRLGDGVISVRPTLARLLSSLLTISSGASIGREGGMVQLSALVASSLGRIFRVSRPQLRLLVACGGAAGMASAYNTPLAGALFVAEVVMQSLAIEALGPLIVSALVATLTIRHWIGMSPIFTSPEFNTPVHFLLLPILGLAVFAGILAPVFLWLLEQAKALFKLLPLPLPFSLALGGLLVGFISIDQPGVWGNGHAVVESLLNHHPAVDWVLALLALKILATAASVGSGAIGGVFTPTLFVGAAVGWLYCAGLQFLLPGIAIDSVTYAALGMGALLAGTTHAPVMAILMIFEMTLDSNLLLPLIIVTIISRYLSSMIRPLSVYSHALGDSQTRLPYLMHVADLQLTPGSVVNIDISADKVSELFCFSATACLGCRSAGLLSRANLFAGHETFSRG